MNFYSFVFISHTDIFCFCTEENRLCHMKRKKNISDHNHISVTLANEQYFWICDKCSVDKPLLIILRN